MSLVSNVGIRVLNTLLESLEQLALHLSILIIQLTVINLVYSNIVRYENMTARTHGCELLLVA